MKKMYKLIMACGALILLGTAKVDAQPYCIPTVGSTADSEIYTVTLGTMTNNTTCGIVGTGPGSSVSQYANYTGSLNSPNVAGSVAAPNLTMGQSYPAKVGYGTCNGNYSGRILMFIDYNQDGDFLDATELVWNTTGNAVNLYTAAVSGLGIMIPFSATPGLTRMRVWLSETSVAVPGPCDYITWGEVEDYCVNIVSPTPCVTTPAANTVVATSTLVCPVFGTSGLSLATTYTLGAISYTWQVSNQSALGPYTNVIGANQMAYTTPTLSGTTWYQLVAQCANGGSTIAATPVQIQVATTTTNNVPYFESFEGITQNKELPNCSWFRNDNFQASTNIAANGWRVPRTGTKFAEFDASNQVYNQTRYYYSNGIQMYPGITYSASVWYLSPGYATWYNVGLLYGPNQTPTGLQMLQQIAYPNNTTYNLLSNTFQVATAGLYYMAVRATEYGYASQMVWDDLQVIAPCQYSNNAAPLVVTGPTQICAGQQANFTASGAGTYSWSTGVATSSLNVSPPFTTTYSITGTNSLSGCFSTIPKTLVVNQLPPVSIIAFQPEVCVGSSVSMFAASGLTYTWSAAGAAGAAIVVSPAATTIYSVSGSDAFGCVGTATQQIVVNPLPAISIMPVTKTICKGEMVTLTASGATGATSYMWNSSSSFFQSTTINASPMTTQNFTVSGTDDKGCTGVANVVVIVETCAGVSSVSGNTVKATVFPSPNNGEFTVALNNGLTKTIEVVDLTGRVVLSTTTENNEVKMNISTLSNGVYYVKVKSDNTVEVLKVVKQ